MHLTVCHTSHLSTPCPLTKKSLASVALKNKAELLFKRFSSKEPRSFLPVQPSYLTFVRKSTVMSTKASLDSNSGTKTVLVTGAGGRTGM